MFPEPGDSRKMLLPQRLVRRRSAVRSVSEGESGINLVGGGELIWSRRPTFLPFYPGTSSEWGIPATEMFNLRVAGQCSSLATLLTPQETTASDSRATGMQSDPLVSREPSESTVKP